jgi:hypothetical protein
MLRSNSANGTRNLKNTATDRDLARVALFLSLDRKGQAATQRDPFSWWGNVVEYFASCP